MASPGQRLENPGFEQGTEGWFWLEGRPDWTGFEASTTTARSGDTAARAVLASPGRGDVLVAGLVQNVSFDRLPERLEGHYFVERWQTGVDKTYLQAVVSLFPEAGATDPICPGLAPSTPCQVAFPLAGLERIPFAIQNRQFVFVGTADPVPGTWTEFAVGLREEMTLAWGKEPRGFSHAWVYFEARYERSERDASGAEVDVVVHWDDLGLRG